MNGFNERFPNPHPTTKRLHFGVSRLPPTLPSCWGMILDIVSIFRDTQQLTARSLLKPICFATCQGELMRSLPKDAVAIGLPK